jgi:hypothetical protein
VARRGAEDEEVVVIVYAALLDCRADDGAEPENGDEPVDPPPAIGRRGSGRDLRSRRRHRRRKVELAFGVRNLWRRWYRI